MPSVFLDSISFSYGSVSVLENVSINVSSAERAFVVGPNGSGKTTLLKIVSGELCPDSDRVHSSGHSQLVPDPETFVGTVRDYVDSALAPLTALSARFNEVTQALADSKGEYEDEYDRIFAKMNAHDVWSVDVRIDEAFGELGLGQLTDVGERSLSTLSPGQQARLKLAVLLILSPEVLILDEPTNHLDDRAIGFLTRLVNSWDGPVLVASHDRAFIEQTATVIYDLDIIPWKELAKAKGEPEVVGIYRNAGNYSAYLEAKAIARSKHEEIHAAQQSLKRDLREHRKDSMKIAKGGVRVATAARKEKKLFTDRAAKTSVKRTRNDDVQLERLARREVRKPRHDHVKFEIPQARLNQGLAVSVREASVTGRLAPVSFDLGAGEHLLVTGQNGAGKSTLLNWIATGMPPARSNSSGSVERYGEVGLVGQNLPARGLDISEDAWVGGIGEIGKGFLHPSMWATAVSELSAGNQRRAQLALALERGPLILVVDEPTNYLDLDAMQALEESFSAWNGTLVITSHDRWLINHWWGRRLHLEPSD